MFPRLILSLWKCLKGTIQDIFKTLLYVGCTTYLNVRVLAFGSEVAKPYQKPTETH